MQADRKPLNLIILGAPGAGKGTHSKFIVDTYHIPHISTGDIFRDAISEGTPMGLKAQEFISRGELVPDDITVGIVRERLLKPDAAHGFLLDGFPRTLAQAEALERMLAERNTSINAVIDVICQEDVLLRRITTRRVCPKCGASFNVLTLKPKVEGICDYCGALLIQRKDDTEEAFRTRLKEFHTKTAPLADYYRSRGVLFEYDSSDGDINRGNHLIGTFLDGVIDQ